MAAQDFHDHLRAHPDLRHVGEWRGHYVDMQRGGGFELGLDLA